MQQSILNNFDNQQLLRLDPLVNKGYSLVASKLFNAVEQFPDNPKQRKQEFLMKIYAKQTNQYSSNIILDILSEEDIFFHYRRQIDLQYFKILEQQQQLSTTFEHFPQLVVQILQDVNRNKIQAFLKIQSQNQVQLKFSQTVNFKQINVLSVKAQKPEKQIAYQLIAYRYSFLKTEVEKMSGRVMDVRQMLRVKNPQLLLQFNKL